LSHLGQQRREIESDRRLAGHDDDVPAAGKQRLVAPVYLTHQPFYAIALGGRPDLFADRNSEACTRIGTLEHEEQKAVRDDLVASALHSQKLRALA
jgi:hypothetical protein